MFDPFLTHQKVLAGSSYRAHFHGLFRLFPLLHLFYCISFLSASSFYCIFFYQLLVLRLFFIIHFLTRQKKQANPDGSGPFSFVALSNIWCRSSIWLPIGGGPNLFGLVFHFIFKNILLILSPFFQYIELHLLKIHSTGSNHSICINKLYRRKCILILYLDTVTSPCK